MLEDYAVDRITSNQHIGFGLMGEQGAESIHARFNRLYKLTARSPQPVVEKLKYIMKEHLLSISPTLITAKPPPRKKKSQKHHLHHLSYFPHVIHIDHTFSFNKESNNI